MLNMQKIRDGFMLFTLEFFSLFNNKFLLFEGRTVFIFSYRNNVIR